MQLSLAEKARAGRRAALSALNAKLSRDTRVVSIFEGSLPRRQAVPEFHSVRHAPAAPAACTAPVLVLTRAMAAA